MFERYTPDARRVIFFARYEASLVGASALDIDHLWLGILKSNKRLLKRYAPHITSEVLLQRMAQHGTASPRGSITDDMPLSCAAKCALAAAAGPDPHSQSPIKVEDLILALLEQERKETTATDAL